MKRTAQTFFFVLLFASTVFGATQRYVVVTRSAVEATRAQRMLRDIETSPSEEPHAVRPFRLINGFAADLTDEEAAALRKAADVQYVSPVVERHALDLGPAQSLVDNANPFAQIVPYGVDLVRAREVWPVTRGEGINVVVVDTGVDYTHPEIAPVYAGGYNTYSAGEDAKDDNGHGTHVAGTIAAADNNVGVVGIAPNVRLWAVKVLDSAGSGTSDRIISALDWVTQKKNELGGDWVLNFSLGSTTPDAPERQAFAKAIANGLLVCAASGNESTTMRPAPLDYPAAYTGVLAVGAIDQSRTIASFSNQGASLGLVAPGVSVLSTVPLGTGSIAGVQTAIGSFSAAEIQYSGRGSVTAPVVNCGIGQTSDFPPDVAGKIALIQRGQLFFNQKAHNALNAGAIGIIIYNDNRTDMSWSLASDNDPTASTFTWPVTIAVSHEDGLKLAGLGSAPVTITDQASDYETLSGTSMATPHAAGVAALVWSVAPELSASDIEQALEANAEDLGSAGFDTVYGNGLIDALTAAKALAPSRFGTPVTPPPSGPRTRAVRRH